MINLTLPNLDYKIVCGNSLLNIEIDLFNSEELKELEKLKHNYVNLSDKKEKIKEKEKIDNILNKYAKEGQFDFKVFFSEVFSKNGGFDVIIANPPYVQLQKLKNSLIEEGIYKGKTYQKLYKEQNYKVYEGMGDLYCLFYEKGINILRNNGILTYITSNKWMRAGYGGSLREYLIKYNPLVLIDLGSNIFESATVDTNILLVKKESYKKNTLSCFYREHKKDLGDYVKQNNVSMEYTKDNWVILDPIEKSIKEKVEKYGKKLKDWDITINYGIKTGCNEAFIINEETKNKLIEEDPRSEELIKPVLRGKDIKRNKINYAGLYLINITCGWTNQNKGSVDAEKWFKENYTAIYNHFEAKSKSIKTLKNRLSQGDYYWECQNKTKCDKIKIIYPKISQNNNFYYDQEGKYYINNTAYIITGNKNEYLIKLLNSKITEFIFGNYYCIILGDGGLRWKYQEIINLPVFYPTEQQEKEILNAKTDEEIDALIAKYYHLVEEEFEFIKNYRR